MDKIKKFFGRFQDDGKSRAASLSILVTSSPPTPAPTANVTATTTTSGPASDPSSSIPSAVPSNPMLVGWAPRLGTETANQGKLEEKQKEKEKQKDTLPRGAALCANCRCLFLMDWNHPVACHHHVGRVMIRGASALYGVPALGDGIHPRSAFVWSCCAETVGRSAGCKSGPHRAGGQMKTK